MKTANFPLVHRYAKALFILAQEQKSLEIVEQDLEEICELIQKSPEFAQWIQNPLISSKQSLKLLENLFQGKLNKMTLNFILFLSQKRRLEILKSMCEDFKRIYLEYENVVKAEIITNFELNSHEVQEILSCLQKKMNKKIESWITFDPSVLGGLKIKMDHMIYDLSLRTQLEKFKQEFMRA